MVECFQGILHRFLSLGFKIRIDAWPVEGLVDRIRHTPFGPIFTHERQAVRLYFHKGVKMIFIKLDA